MRVNPKLKEFLETIERESIKYANEGDELKKYIRRMTNYYVNELDNSEQVFLMSVILKELSHRKISLDEKSENLKVNLAIKFWLHLTGMCSFVMILFYALFGENNSIKILIRQIVNLF